MSFMRNTLNWYCENVFVAPSAYVAFQFAELKRLERDHAKEKQKLTKDRIVVRAVMAIRSNVHLTFMNSKEPANQG